MTNAPLLLAACLAACGFAAAAESTVKLQNLRCEYLVDPLGIDRTEPRLSWNLVSQERGQLQTAYQVLVAASPELLARDQGDLWDSGKVTSDRSIQVEYAGKALASQTRCYWKVRVWDRDGVPTAWSAPAHWSMGLLKPSDWHGKWIGLDGGDEPPHPVAEAKDDKRSPSEQRRLPARMLRRDFTAAGKIRQATAYVCGLGLFELYLNGRKVSDNVLQPGLTQYDKRQLYVTFDVSQQVRQGANALGVMLGNGRYYAPRPKDTAWSFGYPKLILQLHLEYDDGTAADVVSDESWKMTTEGPIGANNEYDGEEYDARREMPGWSEPGFAAKDWKAVQVVASPGGVLSAQMTPPIRVVETIHPVAISKLRPNVFIYDMGQNMVGWCRLRVSGPAGSEISLRHAENLARDGSLDVRNLRTAKVTDRYILKGKGAETYEPRFTYHGFRYVEVIGLPTEPTLANLEGCVVHDDLASAGTFTCSNPLLNQIYRNIRWGTRGNYRSIPTDCPQRDERQGWLGDRSEECKGEAQLFDVAPLYTKWMQDIEDAQRADGSVSDVCPSYWPLYTDNVTWPSSFILIPGMLYEQYDDRRVIRDHYDGMRRWIEHMRTYIKDDLIPQDRYGDWCVPPESQELIHSKDPNRKTAGELLGSAYFYHDLRLMAGYAELLGKKDDAKGFGEQAEKMKAAFNKKFYKPDMHQYDNGTDTSSILPLAFRLVAADQKKAVFKQLADKIVHEHDSHVGNGLIGGQFLMRVLTSNGRADLAYTIATQKTYPSWGYMISQNATTIWELWNGNTADPAMNSGNHVMLIGDLCLWMHQSLAGIGSGGWRHGFKRIVMRPIVPSDLASAEATHESPYGEIRSSWRRAKDRFEWDITIPPNTSAVIHFPAAADVSESGKALAEVQGVKVLDHKGDWTFEATSGTYRFVTNHYRGGK